MTQYLVAYNDMDTGLGNRVGVVLTSQILAKREDRHLPDVCSTVTNVLPPSSDPLEVRSGPRLPRSTSFAV